MNTSIQNPEPKGIVQPSNNQRRREGTLPAWRKPPGRFTLAGLLAGLVLLVGAPSARADRSPPGCTGSGLGIDLYTSLPDVHIGDTLYYSVLVANAPFPSCDAGETNPAAAGAIVAYVVTPDGFTNYITLLRTFLAPGESDYYTNVVSYVVRAQDIRPDGTVRATAVDQGDIHQNIVNSVGGGEQGVNTQVNQPCVLIAAQCVGSVGENGAISFTGTVTNCGNNTLVGVTVTNFNDNGYFTVLFPTNLAFGEVASFSGSWVPSNPCGPSTAILTVLATDQFTATPRTLTNFTTITCQNTLTAGIKVAKSCPAEPVSPGQLLTFSGSVSNTGNVTLSNIVVVDSQPVANTTVFAAASLAPGALTTFSGSYPAPTNCSVSDTLTATASSRCGLPVSDTASATCPILTTPRIVVTALCPVTPAVPGGTLTYSGTVRNAGDTTLTNIVVVRDSPAPNVTVFTAAALAPGASTNFTSGLTVPANACSVTTTFSGQGEDICTANMVTNTVSTTCPITTAPALAVTLACPAVPAATGGLITYTGTVTNLGNVTLNNVTVIDSQSVPSTVLAVPSLAPGASANFTASFTAPVDACSVSSTVTATGSDACTANMVTNVASATCPLTTNPRLVVTENCPETPVSPGGVLSYSGSVSNSGNITLTNIVVTNDRSGATPVFTAAALLPGASTNFTGSYTVPASNACSVTAVVTATGEDICTGTTVTATNSATCPVTGTPLIAVTLDCPVVPVAAGALITYAGTVSNPGNVPLSNVVVVNNQASPSTVLTVPSLAPGASANFTASFTSPADACSVSSTATATGSNACTAITVTNTATATCSLVTAPRIVVTQNCPSNPASPGGVLTYSGTVCNSGNTTLTNIVVVNNQQAAGTNAPGGPFSFGTITPPLVPPAGTLTDRFVVGSNLSGLTYADQDEGYGATQFYSLRQEESASSTFVTINASGTVTGRFNAGNYNFDALSFAAPDVGYGPVIFYYLRHDNAGVSSFGTIKPGGVVGVVADLFVVGNNFDALTFAATDVGYGANLFYYLRHNSNGPSIFGTINPALPGTITDRFNVGTNFDALVFTATDVGYGADLFYYLRHDSNGLSTFGTISAAGTVADRFNVGTNLTELAFTTTDVGYGANLFYCLGGGGNSTGTNTNSQPVFAVPSLAPGACTNFTGSYTVPGTNVCSVTAILTVTATDICSGNTVTNTSTATCPLTTTPRIAVTLDCSALPAAPGGLVTYAGTVSNPGNVTLDNVVVVDSQASPSTVLTVPSLAPGASSNFTASFNAPANACAVSSTVTATGSDACTANRVTNSASAICPLTTNPRLVVTENCPASPVNAGGLLTYSGTVSNAGNITLTNIVVTNDRSGATPVFTAASLAPGASDDFTGSFTVPPGSCSVTAIVTATAEDTCAGIAVTNTVSTTCQTAGTPLIVVTQTCPVDPVSPGGILTYSGTVSNAGNVTLTNVIVVNNRPASNTVILTLASLAPGATANFTGTYQVPLNCCVVSSTVDAAGQDICTGVTVADTFTAVCTVFTVPQIVVTKVCPPTPTQVGEVLQYSGTVSNAGTVALVSVTVVNDQPSANSPVLGPITLAPGQSVSYNASYSVAPDSCGADTVTARGLDACTLAPVVDSVTTTCPVITSPRIAVTKNCPSQITPRGGVFTYTGTVSNPGNVTLTNVVVEDNYEVDCYSRTNGPVIGPITLAPGASTNFSASYTAPRSCCSFIDTLTASGQDRCAGTLVTATATAECPLLSTPQIAVVMHCPAASVPVGGLYVFTGSVTNTGDVVLTNVYVFSSQPVTNTPLLGPIDLAPGETEDFSGSYLVTAGSAPASGIVTASGMDTCQGRTVTAAANCAGPISAITVVINGNGTVSGVTNGQLLNLGQSYTATATPAAGSSFVNWSGPVSGTSPSLTFVMQTNLVLTANFALTPPNNPSPLTIVINGNGSVSGVTNGQLLNLGQSYTATATPAAGSSFVNWSGPVSGTSPSLTFVMQSNLVLTANFVLNRTNVFIPVAGVFNGLFFDPNDVQSSSSGGFSLTMTAAGTYKATIQNTGKSYAVKGRFDTNGQAINTIRRTGASLLTVNWQGNLSDPDYLSGTVSDGTLIAQLEGGRDVFKAGNPAPQAGRYTLIIPGIEDATDSPAGSGYGSAKVDANGVVHFTCSLADGTVAVQNVALSKNGEWPVYISLYQGKGMLIGWLQFANDGTNDLSGALGWTKPNLPTSKLYKLGFSVNSEVIGSHYVAPIGTAKMLQITDGVVLLSGGNLPDSSNPVTFGPSSKLVNNGPNALKLIFMPASGYFSGTFREAGTTEVFPTKGAVLQRQNYGSGYAPGSNQTGLVIFRAVP